MVRLVAFVTIPAAVVAVASAAPVVPAPKPRPAPVYYFPTVVGDERVFRTPAGDQRDVVSAVTGGRGDLVVTTTDPGRPGWDRVVAVSEGRVAVLGEAGRRHDTPLLILLPGAAAGDTWVRSPGTAAEVHRLVGSEAVEVPGGTFTALRKDYGRATPAGLRVAGSVWFVPGVGAVRHVHGGVEVLALKSFTPGTGKLPPDQK